MRSILKDVAKGALFIGLVTVAGLYCVYLVEVRPMKHKADSIHIGMTASDVENILGTSLYRCKPHDKQNVCPPPNYSQPDRPITGELLMYAHLGWTVLVYMDQQGKVEFVALANS